MGIIDDYIHRFSPAVRAELQRIRAIAHAEIPDYEEAIWYAMPTIKYQGTAIISFAAYKNHIGIYPCSGHVIANIAELKGYRTSPGAIQETLNNLLPEALIKKIIRERLKQAGSK